MDIQIAKPDLTESKSIYNIINKDAEKYRILPRDLDEIRTEIRSFFVAKHDSGIIGCVSLYIYSDTLAEIRSLFVEENYKGYGIGKKLVFAGEKEGGSLGINQVFALTKIPGFFTKIGYKKVEKEIFPQKIWQDCLKCEHFPNCDETAVLKEL